MLRLAVCAILMLGSNLSAAYDTSPAFSPDNEFIAFVRTEEPDTSSIIIVSPIQNPVLRVVGPGKYPQFNPDGIHLLCLVESPEKSVPEAWLKQGLGDTFTNISLVELKTGETKQLTKQGAAIPVWSEDGGEIAYFTASGALYSLPISGGLPKKIASTVPCKDSLTWLPDWKSFAVTRKVNGKLARYAFSPPSRTPVRISDEYSIPTGAISPVLNEHGSRMAYLVRKQIPEDNETYPGLELWAAWKGGKRKVADIPTGAPLVPSDLQKISIVWSQDSSRIATACCGKVWVVTLAEGKAVCISDAAVENGDTQTPEPAPAEGETGTVLSS